jgi:hypothetical protein
MNDVYMCGVQSTEMALEANLAMKQEHQGVAAPSTRAVLSWPWGLSKLGNKWTSMTEIYCLLSTLQWRLRYSCAGSG